MSLCVCMICSIVPFIFCFIDEDGGVVPFYVIAYADV